MVEAKTVRGYLSSVENSTHFGLGETSLIDTLQVQWSDGTTTEKYKVEANQLLSIDKNGDTPIASTTLSNKHLFEQVSIGQLKLNFKHKENSFDDFQKEILLPYKQSTLGPCISKGDVNKDGLEDLFIGGASGQAATIFIQEAGKFKKIESPALAADALTEDMEALFFDVDQDGDQDIYVVSGGNAFAPNSDAYQDRLYLNDGNGQLTKVPSESLNTYKVSGKSVCGIDYDKDGDTDLIIGNRIIPQNYPKAAPSLF